MAGSPRPFSRRSAVISLTLRGGGFLAAGILAFAIAYIADWPELLILACVCTLPPLLALAVVAWMRPRLTVARFSTPAMVSVGTAGSAQLRLNNLSRRKTSTALWRDRQPWGTRSTESKVLPIIGASAVHNLLYRFVPPRRGITELGPLVIDVTDPFKLARGQFSAGDRQRIVVPPASVSLTQDSSDVAAESGHARLFQHRALAGEHDIMTREYRPGDAMRRVHWKASAHHGSLMVREDEKRSHSEALLLVDTRRGSWRDVSRTPDPDLPESERFEWALSMTASLRDYLVACGIRVSVRETGVPQLAPADQVDDFLESLARVRLTYQDGPALRLSERETGGSGSLFAVIDRPDAETLDALITGRAGYEPAVAFLVGVPDEKVSTALERGGWLIHQVKSGETVQQAWWAVEAPGE